MRVCTGPEVVARRDDIYLALATGWESASEADHASVMTAQRHERMIARSEEGIHGHCVIVS